MDPIDVHSVEGKKHNGSQCLPSTIWFVTLFCVRQKKEIHTGLKQLESK